MLEQSEDIPMLPPTPENLPHGYARCADGALCRMRHPDLPHAGFAHFRHRCADCEGHLHSLCGFEDASLTADGSMHNRYCRSCHAKKRSGDHSSGDGGGRDPPDQSRDVAVAECLAGDATSANTIPGEDQAGSPPNPPHPDPNCSQLEPANSSIASQSEGSAPCTAERHITDPYVSTQSCEEGDGYCPPRTLSVALEASPSPKHPELKARRITAMFAYHEDRRRAIRLTMERQREVERRRAEEDLTLTEESSAILRIPECSTWRWEDFRTVRPILLGKRVHPFILKLIKEFTREKFHSFYTSVYIYIERERDGILRDPLHVLTNQ